MMAAEKLVLLAQDNKTVSLAVIPAAASEAAATFRLIVEQRYRSGGDVNDNEVDTMEDVACRVPVGELRAAAVDRAFEDLMARIDHPTLRPEVAPAVREAAARVRARYAEEWAQLGGVEFVDSLEPEEETGSDLELDEESWERGCWSDGGDWRHDQDPSALISDDEDGAQFSARPYGGAIAREGGPSDGTLLLSGFEALADQHELTSRDVQRLVRLAFDGGDVEGDNAYQRVLDGGAPVSRVTRAVVLDQALRSATATARQQQPTSPRGMPARMRTG
ncbi:uncharacterized protein [Miscanthus floridulus]|uniref:uncharacterized protein n=1 Tax=Miscanthus floridulus TaxID=154761 RepID=UPI003459B943